MPDSSGRAEPVMPIFERESGGRMYRAPVIMAKSDLSSKYVKLVLRQLGFTDSEINVLI
jgi:hypothetical protein